MDELTQYLFGNYLSLFTKSEYDAYMLIILDAKLTADPGFAQVHGTMMRHRSPTPEVIALLENGEEAFRKTVCERILRECADQVFFNRCSKCGALARRPQAKQCSSCFYSWHEAAR